MAGNKKISELSEAPNLDGTEYFPVAKSGFNFKATVAMIKNFIGLASVSNDGLMSKGDRTKLIGVANNATANSSDSTLMNRANHTGKQPISSIVDAARVAATGEYADLKNKPDLTPAGIGAAPVAHVGSGGSVAHAIASALAAGFMSPTHYQRMEAVKQVAFSGYYGDLADKPLMSFVTNGFHWNIDSNTTGGKALNDWSTSGTASYVPLAATGTTFSDNTAYHKFVTAADTYSAAGMKSAQSAVKRGNHPIVGGFVFEAIWGPELWVEGSMGICGLFADASQSFGNFSGTDIGVGIGWRNFDPGAAKLQLMVGDGVAVKAYDATAGKLNDSTKYWVRIICLPNSDKITVDVVDVNTGVELFSAYELIVNLPPKITPLYAIAHIGTTSLAATAITMGLWAMSAAPYPSQLKKTPVTPP